MTDKQINIAIAEACGWHDLSIADKTVCGLKQKATSLNGRYEPIPNYTNDLNAMHEAENVLSQLQQNEYWDHIKDMTGEGFDQLHAIARQRAEAFLRTIGKWEEVQP